MNLQDNLQIQLVKSKNIIPKFSRVLLISRSAVLEKKRGVFDPGGVLDHALEVLLGERRGKILKSVPKCLLNHRGSLKKPIVKFDQEPLARSKFF